jgi:hypothetical protein
MCGGSKGQSSSNTNQTQTYTPNAYAGNAIQGAIQTAQNAAATPFSAPAAPVAGFSQDQQNAFQTVNNAQGMAQPYINTAAGYFSPQGAQQFFNPMADAVTDQLKNIFGQQQQATTGQLTQAAGGVGADRIAVGQSELANQQGLAAGQTYANLYQQAANQAQGAAYGTAALGSQAQNAALSGAQAQLGTGGLQQQLSQAQLNSPYQQQLAQLAYPFQTSQFLTSAIGALAPGLGGTTTGVGNSTSTPAQPSIWSQLLGAGTAGVGLYNGLSNGKGSAAYGGGSAAAGDAYGGSSFSPASSPSGVQLSPSDYGFGFARGGSANPFFSEGGTPDDDPVDIAPQSIVPESKVVPIQPHIPQLNLNPPQQSGGSSSGSNAGSVIGDIAKVAMMFANRGGVVDDSGGFRWLSRR